MEIRLLLKDYAFVSNSGITFNGHNIACSAVPLSHITSNYGLESLQTGLLFSSNESTQAQFVSDKTKQGRWRCALPFVRRIELYCEHIQGIPGGDANAAKETEQGDHGRLAVSKGQEETADTGDHAGARCKGKPWEQSI